MSHEHRDGIDLPDDALRGVRVLDLGQICNGSYCGLLLAHLGADVIKVEPPTGESTRWRSANGASKPFLMLNSNKRGLAVDLKQPAGRDILLRLAADSDVVIENFAVGTMDQLGLGYGLYEVRFDGVRVSVDNILVRDDGFRKMLRAFNGQRCLNAAISIGIAQGAQDAAIEHAKTRSQGGRPIGRYQGIGWILADNAIDIEAARLLVYRAAARAGAGFPSRYEAAIAKTFANEMALRVTDRAMQIFGGHGWAEEVGIERYVRWARYGPLGGGTPQIQRNGIARELLGP